MDAPLASVQMDDTGQMDIKLDTVPFRKSSSAFSFGNSIPNGLNVDTVNSLENNRNIIQMESCVNEPLLALRTSDICDSGLINEEEKLIDRIIPNGHAMTTMF